VFTIMEKMGAALDRVWIMLSMRIRCNYRNIRF